MAVELSPAELLKTLATYLAGEFDNREQALAEPAWYVHLQVWYQPFELFGDGSYTLFVEQANALTPDHPYRQRILRLQSSNDRPQQLWVDHYALKDPVKFKGAGRNPDLLKPLSDDQVEHLPGCLLNISWQLIVNQSYHFHAVAPPAAKCQFTYQGKIVQVSLGFEAKENQLLSYDKGIDPTTGEARWGAMMGPFQFSKRLNFPV